MNNATADSIDATLVERLDGTRRFEIVRPAHEGARIGEKVGGKRGTTS